MIEAAVYPLPDFSNLQLPAFYRARDTDQKSRLTYMASFLRYLTRNSGVQIQYTHTPCTDGKTIWLGNIQDDDPDYEVLVLGHGIHEVMHVLETDMHCVSAFEDKSFPKLLLNVLEDVRIDTLGLKRFGNYKLWRQELIAVLKRRHSLRLEANTQILSAGDLLGMFLHTKLMVHAGFDWAQPYLANLQKGIEKHLSKKALDKIVALAMETFKAQNTLDVVVIVERIMAYLKIEHQSLTAYQPELWDNPEFVDGFGVDSAAALAANFMSAVLNSNCQGPAADLIGTQANASAKGNKHTQVKIADCDAYWPDHTDDKLINEDAKFYSRAFRQVFHLVDNMANDFEMLLETETDNGLRYSETGFDFCRDWIRRLAQGDRRIFAKNACQQEVSAEVCILLDRSGSMGVKTMTRAKAAVLGMIGALKKVDGCQVRAACFPGPLKSHVSIVASPDEPFEEIATRFGKIGAYGSTPVEEALCWGKDSFDFSEDVQNRLLLVITDGRFPSEFSQRLEKQLNQAGVELAILSIDVPNKNACKNSEHITDVKELQPALIRLFSNTELRQNIIRA